MWSWSCSNITAWDNHSPVWTCLSLLALFVSLHACQSVCPFTPTFFCLLVVYPITNSFVDYVHMRWERQWGFTFFIMMGSDWPAMLFSTLGETCQSAFRLDCLHVLPCTVVHRLHLYHLNLNYVQYRNVSTGLWISMVGQFHWSHYL